jgi:transcriptional regulator of acetoin/glycerol metabolism
MQDIFLNEVKMNWKTFIKEGKITDVVNPIIAESWKRSKMYGINHDKLWCNKASDDELKFILEKDKELIKIAKPIMANLSSIVMGTGSTLILIDKDGYLIENIGDENIRK